jgi:hypothetical protein
MGYKKVHYKRYGKASKLKQMDIPDFYERGKKWHITTEWKCTREVIVSAKNKSEAIDKFHDKQWDREYDFSETPEKIKKIDEYKEPSYYHGHMGWY